MKGRMLVVAALLTASAICFAAADGSWLKKVPATDHAKTNPLAGQSEAVAAGANLYGENCSKCHGKDAQGKGSRPALRSDRIRLSSDGDLAWMLRNGQPFKGMPGWANLPEQERWQLVSYLRSLNLSSSGATQ